MASIMAPFGTCTMYIYYCLIILLINSKLSLSQHNNAHENFHTMTNSIESPHTLRLYRRAQALAMSGRCKHVYLDVGTNVGIQIRKLYEPHYYPVAQVKPIFEKYFGTDVKNRSEVCAFGFEPNPHWTSRLTDIDAAYNKHGYPVVIFTSTAANTDNGRNITFFLEPYESAANHEWGASLINWNKNKTMQEIVTGSLPLAHFINNVVHHRKGKDETSKVVMKIDVEGAEYTLLPHLLVNNALCAIDYVTCEFHTNMIADPPDTDAFLRDINFVLHHVPKCLPTIIPQDDESYGVGRDNNPLPARHLRREDSSLTDRSSLYPYQYKLSLPGRNEIMSELQARVRNIQDSIQK